MRRSTIKNAHITLCVAFTMLFNRSRPASASLTMVLAHPFILPYLLQRKPLKLSSLTIRKETVRPFASGWIIQLRHWTGQYTFAIYVVVELEGKTESDIASRKEQVRKLTKAVVPCDITQDPPIESGYRREYDVVIASLVLTSSSRSQKDYLNNLKKLSKMVKPGGRIMIYEVERSGTEGGFYVVGDAKFINASVTSDFVSEALKSAGFDDIVCKKCEKRAKPNTEGADPSVLGFFFLSGQKKTEI